MIANVRQWNALALPRLARRVRVARRAKAVRALEQSNQSQLGFFESYEKMIETQAVLMLGLNNKRW